ncbi:MAG: GNAT family N-acetyltransferase [Gaiellaceae bacterium]
MNVRPPRLTELEDVLALMRAHDAAAWGDSDWVEAELREHWDGLDLERDARVAELDGRLAGYVDFESRSSGRMIADGYVHPELRGLGVGSALVDTVERRAQEEAVENGPAYLLHYAALASDEGTHAFFARRDYRDVRHQWRMVIDLDAEPSVEALPGIEIRPYRAGEERAVHAALEDAWSVGAWLHEPRSFEEYSRGTFGRTGHDPLLYWVALAGEEIAGANLCDWKRNGDWGWIGTLGVRPGFRGRGIAKALLRTAFAEFFARGERRVALGVDAQSPTGATRLYEHVGMRVLYRIAIFEKEIRGA